jgi:hypothetical protein
MGCLARLLIVAVHLLTLLTGCGQSTLLPPSTASVSEKRSIEDQEIGFQGTQVGNPLILLINGQAPSIPAVSLSSSDQVDCSSIDVTDYQAQIESGELLLQYFVLAKRDDGFARNFLGQVSGQTLFNVFGVGSNLELICQAVVFTLQFEKVFSQKSDSVLCSNCGGDQ